MRIIFMEIFVTNNIMLRKDSPRESLDLRVVDFDWAGRGEGERKNQVRYPTDRNTNIKWPGKAGGGGGGGGAD